MERKPDLLYISPVIPAMSGNGLAMRAGTVLESLAMRYVVSLLVVPLYASTHRNVHEHFSKLCRRVMLISPQPTFTRLQLLKLFLFPRPKPSTPVLSGYPDEGLLRQVKRACGGMRFDVIHVFRLSMLPFAGAYLAECGVYLPLRHLDLDDIESTTHARLATLCRRNNDHAMALVEDSQAKRYEALEDQILKEFDRVYVCSEMDRKVLEGRGTTELHVLPNAVRIPASFPPRRSSKEFTFLFVGTLGYYPNEDAVRYFCAEILPCLQSQAKMPVHVNIVGTGASARLRLAIERAGIRLVGAVADIAPWYAKADAVVVPVRAGGGTRIKVLEAFSYRRPVVSTAEGVEGIEVRHREHVLIGKTPQAFAGHCLRLMSDPPLAECLVEKAFALLASRYTAAEVGRALDLPAWPTPR